MRRIIWQIVFTAIGLAILLALGMFQAINAVGVTPVSDMVLNSASIMENVNVHIPDRARDLIANNGELVAATPEPTLQPLKSYTYLRDYTLISNPACRAPCFHGITPGKTTFDDAIAMIKADRVFSNVVVQHNPTTADWSTADGVSCCRMGASDTGIIHALAMLVSPEMTLQQIIDTYGLPAYAFASDFSPSDVVLTVVFPTHNLIVSVAPGNSLSSIKGSSKVVIVVLINPDEWQAYMQSATLVEWNGYRRYALYHNATPVVTPQITPTQNSEPKPTSTPTGN